MNFNKLYKSYQNNEAEFNKIWHSLDVEHQYYSASCFIHGIDTDKDVDFGIFLLKKIMPRQKIYSYDLGCVFYRQQNFEEALVYFKEAISSEIPSASYWVAKIYKNNLAHVDNASHLEQKYMNISAKQGHIFAKKYVYFHQLYNQGIIKRLVFHAKIIQLVTQYLFLYIKNSEDFRIV